MCSNPYEQEAKIEQHKREYAYRSRQNKFSNKTTSYKRTNDRNLIGFSRAKSDIYVKKLDIIGKGRQLTEQATRDYYKSDSAVKAAEGGASRTAGRNDYLALLYKTKAIESKLDKTLGYDGANAAQGIKRVMENKNAANREKLGLPPQFGPLVQIRQQSLWQKTAPIREMASFAMGIPIGADGKNILGGTPW